MAVWSSSHDGHRKKSGKHFLPDEWERCFSFAPFFSSLNVVWRPPAQSCGSLAIWWQWGDSMRGKDADSDIWKGTRSLMTFLSYRSTLELPTLGIFLKKQGNFSWLKALFLAGEPVPTDTCQGGQYMRGSTFLKGRVHIVVTAELQSNKVTSGVDQLGE